jgi:hypothetical protein
LRRTFYSILLASVLVVGAAACGRKADPQPATLVRPKQITNLAATAAADGIRLEWSRPESYVNGRRMDDLGGFLVFRGVPGGGDAEEIGKIAVSDAERFQREKKFAFVDDKAEKGRSYFYRVVAFTTDGYYSEPSNQVSAEKPS